MISPIPRVLEQGYWTGVYAGLALRDKAGWIATGAGFIVGAAFAAILSMTERHRKLEDLSLRRIALWGAIGGFLATGAFNLVNDGTVYWQALLTISLLSAGIS